MTANIRKKEMFFEKDNNAKTISSFIRRAESARIGHAHMAERLRLSKQIMEHIEEFPHEWDEKCQFTIENDGKNFLEYMRRFTQTGQDNINDIYTLSYRFLCEFDFFWSSSKEFDPNLRNIKNKIQNANATDIQSEIIYASYIMPLNILKKFINDPNIGAFQEFEQKKVEAEDLKKNWDKEIQIQKADVEKLKDNLETYKTGFNFVGLNNGFLNLANKKAKEAFWLFWSLIGMGALILGILVFVFGLMGMDGDKNIDYLITILPIMSIEIILIYFFRIILLNHRSVKAQIMQLELRQALCQFIQKYVDYSSIIKAKDANALEKFENLIFSGIISNPEKLPSSFDGVEQVSKFMKNIKD